MNFYIKAYNILILYAIYTNGTHLDTSVKPCSLPTICAIISEVIGQAVRYLLGKRDSDWDETSEEELIVI